MRPEALICLNCEIRSCSFCVAAAVVDARFPLAAAALLAAARVPR
jgi:hypothetical protein